MTEMEQDMVATPEDDIPNEDVHVIGWRMFTFDKDRGGLSGTRNHVWPSATLTAEHVASAYDRQKENSPHHMEEGTCDQCGIYMLDTAAAVLAGLDNYAMDGKHYLASAEAWGIIIKGTLGTRAEHMRITRLYRVPSFEEILFANDSPPSMEGMMGARAVQRQMDVPVEFLTLDTFRSFTG